jgi:hypothetical protein
MVDHYPHRMSPERAMLVCCARTDMDPRMVERARLLARQIADWPSLTRTAEMHGVLPLLFRNLDRTCPEIVPHETLEHLREKYEGGYRRNLVMTGELCRLVTLFQSQDIPVIPFKGPTLAAAAYGHLGLRPFDDLDILIRKQDVQKAIALLADEGYIPQFHFTERQTRAYIDTRYEMSLRDRRRKIFVELQWEIVPRYFGFQLDVQELWSNSQQDRSTELPTLPPEDLLLILCVHGSKHLWHRLSWICDIAQMIRAYPQLNWQRVVESAQEQGIMRKVLLGLSLSNALLETELPKEISRLAQTDATVASLASNVLEVLFRDPPNVGPAESVFFHLKSTDGFRDRMLYMWGFVLTTTPGDWTANPLPGPFFPLYYLIRPLRLAKKYGGDALRRFCHGS